MPRQVQNVEFSTFLGGIVTEATELSFPENSTTDEQNMILKQDGSRKRRLGLDYEDNYQFSSNVALAKFRDNRVTVHKWENAGGVGGLTFLVVQVGNVLSFYDQSQTALSTGEKSFTVDLADHQTGSKLPVGNYDIDTASGLGALIVVSSAINPFYITYDDAAGTIAETTFTIDVRDRWGLADGYGVDENPADPGSDEHLYNLYNQGWHDSERNTYNWPDPSNAQVWFNGRDSSDVFSKAQLNKQEFGNTPAPKGRFILNLFSRDRSAATTGGEDTTTITGLTTETDSGRPSTVSFWAGRVFFSGIDSTPSAGPNLNGMILFSQLVKDVADFGKCYQEGDPTSEFSFELIQTDGGTLTIPELGSVFALVAAGNNMIVIANNAIRVLSGNTAAGFAATGYKVEAVSELGAISHRSIVTAEQDVIYWGHGGAYLLQPSGAFGTVTPTNITKPKIQTLYDAIPSSSKEYCSAAYDPVAKTLHWLYKATATTSYDQRYDTELIYNIPLQAWTKNVITDLASDPSHLIGVMALEQIVRTTQTENVTNDALTLVTNDALTQVTAQVKNTTAPATTLKYLMSEYVDSSNRKMTWGEYNNTSFLDWYTTDTTGIDTEAYLITGYDFFGDQNRRKQIKYMIVTCKQTEDGFVTVSGDELDYSNPSSCQVQLRWDWTDSTAAGKWMTAFEAYRYHTLYIPDDVTDTLDDGITVVQTKTKIRGSGRAISVKFSSTAAKNLHFLGWAIQVAGENEV